MSAEESAWSISDDVRQRLKQAVEAAGGQTKVAQLANIPKGTLNKIINGTGDVGASRILAIAEACQVPIGAILADDMTAAPHHEIVMVPEISDVLMSAGNGHIAPDFEIISEGMPFPTAWLRKRVGDISQLQIVRVNGKSMQPTIQDGAMVMLNRSDKGRASAIYAFRLDNALHVKRLEFQSRRIMAISDNPSYEGYIIDEQDQADLSKFEVLGRVVWTGQML